MQIWDVMTYLVVVMLSLLVFAAYGDRTTTGSLEQLCGSFLLLLLYGVAVIPLGYAYSFGFASPSAAQVCRSCHAHITHMSCLPAMSCLIYELQGRSACERFRSAVQLATGCPAITCVLRQRIAQANMHGRHCFRTYILAALRDVQLHVCRCLWRRCPLCWALWR